jgi:hypothetical protein
MVGHDDPPAVEMAIDVVASTGPDETKTIGAKRLDQPPGGNAPRDLTHALAGSYIDSDCWRGPLQSALLWVMGN